MCVDKFNKNNGAFRQIAFRQIAFRQIAFRQFFESMWRIKKMWHFAKLKIIK